MKPAVRTKILFLALSGLLPATAFADPGMPAPAATVATEQAAIPEVRTYPGKISGDNAFGEENYADAARFYRTYREDAAYHKDTPALLDAYECELNALIMAADVANAEKVLKDYEKIAKKESALSIGLWKIDLLLLQGKAPQAEKDLKKLLSAIPKQDPRRTRAEIMLATAYDLQGKYQDAAEIYAALYKQDSVSDFNRRIAERLIFSLTASGQNEKAVRVLTSLNTDSSERNNEAHHFLNIYLALKGNPGNSTSLKFEKKNVILTSRQDDFFYLITSLIGDEFVRKNDYRSALNAYNLAYLYARNQKEAIAALSRMTVMLDNMKEVKAAAELALTLQDIFQHNTTDLKTRRFVARLFFDAGMTKEALEHYEWIFEKDRTKPDAVIAGLIRKKQFSHAEQLAALYYKKTPDSAEANATRAKIALAQGKRTDAIQLYIAAYRKGAMTAASRAMRLLLDTKAYGQLIDLTQEIIRKQGNHAEAYYYQAQANEILGKLNEARTDFLFCERNGSFLPAQALFNAAAISYRLNNYKLAKDDFKRIVETDLPDYQKLAPEAAYWQALCAYNLNNARDLEKITTAMQKKFPGSSFTAKAMLVLADVYSKSGLPRKAEMLLLQIANSDALPALRADALYKLAELAFREKHYINAENLLLKIRTDYAEVAPLAENYYLLGDIYRAQNKFIEAAEAYEEAAKRRPGSQLAQAATGSRGDCFFALATTTNNQSHFKEAKEVYEQLLNMQDILPEFRIMTFYKVARCMQLLGETDQAFNQYRLMLSSEPLANAETSPVTIFWIAKGMNAMELIALKSTSIEKINDAIHMMNILNRKPGRIRENQNYPARIQRLNNYKLQLINSGETKK